MLLLLLNTLLFIGGFILWTFTEYGLHNWAGHLPRGRHQVSREHLEHHRNLDYFTPASRKVYLALPVVAILTGICVSFSVVVVQSVGFGAMVAFGFVVGWTWYEVLHRRIHTHAPLNAYGTWARRHHFHHHFADHKLNHGVTTDLWDRVFATRATPERIRIPERKVLPWMLATVPLSALSMRTPCRRGLVFRRRAFSSL